MFDIKAIRDNPEAFDQGLKRRGMEPLSGQILRLDARWREFQTQAEQLQAERNRLAKEIGAAINDEDEREDLSRVIRATRSLFEDPAPHADAPEAPQTKSP